MQICKERQLHDACSHTSKGSLGDRRSLMQLVLDMRWWGRFRRCTVTAAVSDRVPVHAYTWTLPIELLLAPRPTMWFTNATVIGIISKLYSARWRRTRSLALILISCLETVSSYHFFAGSPDLSRRFWAVIPLRNQQRRHMKHASLRSSGPPSCFFSVVSRSLPWSKIMWVSSAVSPFTAYASLPGLHRFGS